MDDNSLKRYADLVISVGVNLYPGQCLMISTGIANYDFALLLAESAYKRGAKYVDIKVSSNKLTKTRINQSKDDYIEYLPDYTTAIAYEQLAKDWASIRIDNTEELDVLKDIDSTKMSAMNKAVRQKLKTRMDHLMRHKHPWCVICAPGPKWAGKVMKTQASDEAVDKLWESMKPIIRLDKDDPIQAWKEHGETLINRSKTLDNINIDKLVFKSDETNLEIGLTPTSIWVGGPTKTPDGRLFFPNIPTEELFTTPDFRRTNGRVKTTRPVKVMETIVRGVYFEFKDGAVVDYGADEGKEILDKYLSVDEGSKFLGEVALVDVRTPIFQSGLIFDSILYDENASSHIALGAAYPSCLSNGNELISDTDKREVGCNVSLVHTDFMIGSHQMDVIAVDKSGKEHQIMKDGKFTI
jgi:aminopeptidase